MVTMERFRDFLAAELPGSEIVQLSDTNNLVYLVRAPDGPLVAKQVVDLDIPLTYLAEANTQLAGSLRTQQIIKVYDTGAGAPFDAILSEYVEGRDLASVVAEGGPDLPVDKLVGYLRDFVLACRKLPRLCPGFGLYKRTARVCRTHAEFLELNGGRYWGRVRPFYAGTPVVEAVDEWLGGGLAREVASHPTGHTVLPIDANLRNFVVTPSGAIVLLNVPIAALSTPAHGVAAVSVHLRHNPLWRPFLAAAGDLCPGDVGLVPHFELWTMLGILSFYAVRQPQLRAEWRDWGSSVPLYDDCADLVRTLLIERSRP